MAAQLQQLSRVGRLRRRLSGQLGNGGLGLGLALGLCLGLLPQGSALAQSVVLSGRMGDRALLVVDGQPHAVHPGQTVAGVKLLRWNGDTAEVERNGQTYPLQVGGTPANLGAAAPRTSGREIVMTAGSGGHFTAAGSINGKQVRFMVDTGATLVSLGRDDAERLGIDLRSARRGSTQTANGTVPIWLVTLNSVRVGDVELTNVGAAVVPQAMPMVLLGNSFLARLQMKRDNDVMRLELK